MKKIRLTALILCILWIFTACAASPSYPTRPLTMVIPFSAGNASDIFARRYAAIASEHLGQTIQCINISGSQIGEAIAYVYEQPADGYTIMEVTPSLLLSEMRTLHEIQKKKAESSAPILILDIIFRDEFEPLLRVEADIQLFGVAHNSRFGSLDELLSYAKEHPGEITIGGVSPGGLDEYIARGFAKAAGIEWRYVSYQSSDQALEAMLNGTLDVYQDKMLRFLPLAQSETIRPLVVLHDEQIDVDGLKNCPATEEEGIPFTQGSWRGFVVKKGTPQEVKDKLIEALKSAYNDSAYVELSKKNHTNIRTGYMEADEWRAEWDAEYTALSGVFME